MAYKQNDLGLLIKLDSEAAEKKILEAAEKCGASVGALADYFNAHRRSMHRWIAELGLHEKLGNIRRESKVEDGVAVGVDMAEPGSRDKSVRVRAERTPEGKTRILSVEEIPRRRRGVSLA
jgi:hypothetical protein